MQQELLISEDDDLALIGLLKNVLLNLKNSTKDYIDPILNQICITKKDLTQANLCVKNWEKVIKRSGDLMQLCEHITLAEDWKSDAELIIEAYDLLTNSKLMSFSEFLKNLKSLSSRLSQMIENLSDVKIFKNLPLLETEREKAKKALKLYIDTSEAIVGSSDYKESNVHKLDCLLSNTAEFIQNMFAATCSDLITNTENTFVALAAPSMEGKTQTAFNLREVEPLYFVLSETGSSEVVDSQDIYLNFRNHSVELNECVMADLELIGSLNGKKMNTVNADVTASILRSTFLRTKFWTLGFLEAITKSSESRNKEEIWMEYYSRIDNFSYSAVSISECLESSPFKKYCLFLDEYISKPWFVFVRNLARIIGLRCVCSNTNTVITNIVGKKEFSGSSGSSIWSIVIVRLNPPSLDLLNQLYSLENSIKLIKSSALRNIRNREGYELEDKNPICCFLNKFLDTQLKCLRPGVAMYVAKALKAVSVSDKVINGTVTLGWLMDAVVGQLKTDLVIRKPSLLSKDIAFFAKTGLLVPEAHYGAKDGTMVVKVLNSDLEPEELQEKVTAEPVESDESEFELEFESEEDTDIYMQGQDENVTSVNTKTDIIDTDNDSNDGKQDPNFYYQRKFIKHHLYYVCNPQIAGAWLFLTFPPENPGEKLLTFFNGFKKWDYEYTHFESNELLTMLACLFISSSKTISTYLKKADESIYSNPEAIFDNPNLRALKLSGNALEFSTSVSIVNASQHTFETNVKVSIAHFVTDQVNEVEIRKYSFQGQNGTGFLKNLIVNLIVDDKFENGTHDNLLKFEFFKSSNFDLKIDYLDKCKIPFLYGINRTIPLLDSLSEMEKDDFFVSKYIRTANDENIDGKFKFFIDNEEARVVVECKNQRKEITAGALKEIFIKALNRKINPKLCLIFCRQASNEIVTMRSKLFNFCESNKINFFRVDRTELKKFIVRPFFAESSSILPDPRFVCILFESSRINRKF